ncbi:MAG: HU family DNA-binding protein [Desulfofundulus sp.]
MTKTELVKAIAQKTSLKQKDVDSVINEFFRMITVMLASDGEVRFPGFGSFAVVERAPKQGRNPQTGEPIAIPARKVVVFRVGKSLKEAVCEAQ